MLKEQGQVGLLSVEASGKKRTQSVPFTETGFPLSIAVCGREWSATVRKGHFLY